MQEPSGLKGFYFVPLADDAGTDKVLHCSAGVRHVEVAAEAMKCALNTFVFVVVGRGEDRGQQGGRGGHEQAALEGKQSMHDLPLVPEFTGFKSHAKFASCVISNRRRPELREQVERGRGHGVHSDRVGVTARECVCHDVCLPRLVLH